MLYRQIRYFVAVVKLNSFTKAAEAEFISQSAISQQIQALEHELGVKLLERRKRTFYLTEAGRYFYQEGRKLLKETDRVIEKTREISRDEKETLNIGYLNEFSPLELQRAIQKFSTIYPEVHLKVVSGSHETLFHIINTNQCDIIISDQRRVFNEDYFNEILIQADLGVEISINHALAKKEVIDIKDLKKYRTIIICSADESTDEKDFYQNILGFGEDYLFAETIKQAELLTASNQGVFPIIMGGTLDDLGFGLVRKKLTNKNKPIKRNICAFWEKERTSYYIEEFTRILREELTDN